MWDEGREHYLICFVGETELCNQVLLHHHNRHVLVSFLTFLQCIKRKSTRQVVTHFSERHHCGMEWKGKQNRMQPLSHLTLM